MLADMHMLQPAVMRSHPVQSKLASCHEFYGGIYGLVKKSNEARASAEGLCGP